jgi:hypothetical protein
VQHRIRANGDWVHAGELRVLRDQHARVYGD